MIYSIDRGFSLIKITFYRLFYLKDPVYRNLTKDPVLQQNMRMSLHKNN